jgi:low affinity Fe/Cu permease
MTASSTYGKTMALMISRKFCTVMYFDHETLALLRTTLDRAWASLPPSEQARTSRSLLAERILKAAAQGERDADCLHARALSDERMATGPFFSFSDTWQLVMNTWTNVATFLMVFLIQNSQNRDSSALQAKLDELIRTSAARNSLVGIERLTPEEIETIRQSVETLARQRSDTR